MVRPTPILGMTLLVLGSFASPTIAAESSGGPVLGGSFYVFTRDVPIPFLAPIKQGVVGLGYQMTGKWGTSPHWGWTAGLEYGVGDFKIKQTGGGPSNVDEQTLTNWLVRGGFDYWSECCGLDWYCGPGVSYQSTKMTLKSSGSPDDELEPMKLYALDVHAGAIHDLSGRMKAFGEMGTALGVGSWEQTETGVTTKLNGWFNTMTWRGGLRYAY
jgi:hypothetical protein